MKPGVDLGGDVKVDRMAGVTPTMPPSSREAAFLRTQRSDAAQIAEGAGLRPTAPPSGEFTSLDAPLVLPERIFFERLDDLTRRLEMLTALVQAGGLSRVHGSRAIQAALGSVAASAEEAQVSSLGSLARVLQLAVGELVDEAHIGSQRALDVLLLDEYEISRDFAAIAVEAQGHLVRCAKTYEEFIGLLAERLPDFIVTEVTHGATPARTFCRVLADLLHGNPVRLVLFSALPAAELEELKKISGASAAISKELGLTALVTELGRLFEDAKRPIKRSPTQEQR